MATPPCSHTAGQINSAQRLLARGPDTYATLRSRKPTLTTCSGMRVSA